MNNLIWDDILVLGDSFTKQRFKDYDWPKIVAKRITGLNPEHDFPVRGKGFSGASWWATRKLLINELQKHKPKVLILTHTEMQRIPSDQDYGLNSASVFNTDHYAEGAKHRLKEENLCPLEVLLAGQEYYKHLFSKDFHLWCQQSWFEELDRILDHHQIEKVIHFHTFNPWDKQKLFIFRNGITFDKPLWPISDDHAIMSSTATFTKVSDNLTVPNADMWAKNPTRNHFSSENNIKLADLICRNLENYNNGLRTLDL